jgi:hypothetical protein
VTTYNSPADAPLIAPYYSRRTGRVVAGASALASFLNGDKAARRPADKLPAPSVSPDALTKFRTEVERHVKRSKQPLVYVSRGRSFVFYLSPKGGRLLVRVRPAKVNKLAEALARAVKNNRACRYRGLPFQPRGRAIYCSSPHAARARHERRVKVRQYRERAAQRLVEAKRLESASVENAKRDLRAHRAALRRHQRARKKLAAAVDQREAAYKGNGGKN